MAGTRAHGQWCGIDQYGTGRDAQPFFEQAAAMFKEQGVAPFHAITLIHLGKFTELGLGNPEKARAYHEEALAEARLINENWLISFALNNLGEVARTQGQFDLARKYYEECESLLRATGDRGMWRALFTTWGTSPNTKKISNWLNPNSEKHW